MQFPLELTENNVKKLMRGYPTQLKKEQLHSTKHYVKVHPLTHQKLTKAKMSGKGIRLTLTPEEFNASGEGFMDILRGIKKGAQWVKKNIIDSNIYQTDIKPIVRKLVDSGVTAAQPMLGPIGPLVKSGVDKLGEVTSAYGLIEPVVLRTPSPEILTPPMKKATRNSRKENFEKSKAKPKATRNSPKENFKATKGEGVRMTTGGSFFIN